MAKTYTAAGSAIAGEVYTASAHNVIVTDVNNLIVPAALRLNLTTSATITNGSSISWSSEAYDTDGMWSSGSTITVNTTGLYVMTFNGFVTAATSLAYAISQINIGGDVTHYGAGAAILGGNSGYISQSVLANIEATNTITFAVAFSAVGAVTLAGTTNDATRTRATVTWVGRTS